MDLNFHLLTPVQINKLQNICLFFHHPQPKEEFSFSNVRETVDVIIECSDNNGDHPVYKKRIADKTTKIKESIFKEKDRRRKESQRTLPEGMSQEDIYEEWPGDDNHRGENYNFGEYFGEYFGDDIENWPEDLEADFENDNPESYDRLIDKYSGALLNIQLPQDNDETYFIGAESYSIATNVDLKIMALEFFRLKSDLIHSKYDINAATGVTTLGQHVRHSDYTRKSEVFLFIDNIENEAKALTDNGVMCSTDDLLEITFIHEMFHAFYAFNSRHDLIFLRNFHEIEEAMTEMGTIWFCSLYDGGRLFSLARHIVNGKWIGSSPSLYCYGLGACLFWRWNAKHYGMITDYQLVQRMFRYGNPNVTKFCYKLSLRDDSSCSTLLYDMINSLKFIKGNPCQHLFFRNQTTGENNTLVETVLKHLATYGGRVPKYIYIPEKGYQPVCKDETAITAVEQNRFDMNRTITPLPGTTYRIWKNWNKGLDHNTIVFIDEIIRCYYRGWISGRVTII